MAMAAVAVITAFLATTLRRTHPEYAMAVGLVAGVLLVSSAMGYLSPLLEDVRLLLDQSGVASREIGILFKSLGICLLTQLAADACRDAGESGLAAKTELAGKLVLLAMALPLFQTIRDVAISLMETG